MAAKCSRREMAPSSSSEEEATQVTRIDRCPVLIGMNIDLASFTFDAPSFHIDDLSSSMGWDGGIRLYTTKTILHLEEYNPVEACRRVTGKHFETPTRLSTNQLTLIYRVLHNIIAHIIVPRKGLLDEVNHYDVFLLDSILIGQKLDLSYIMLQHMNSVHSGTRPKRTGNGWQSPREFDDESGLSTLPFEGGEKMDDDDEDEPPPRPRSQRPSSSTFGFTEDYFNLLNGQIESLTSSVDGLHNTAEDLRNTMRTLQESVKGITALLQTLHSRLDAVLPLHPPQEN
ncbi:zf-RVT domain-containing protein [Abeliophyllum distichum]|uniref:Zf-RVT domain-containing protein n=1 Tax=Abeliophyllum distichum TaxID=126358 RepID=A0ABD1SZP8_9LAMI